MENRLRIVLDTNVFLVSLAENYKYHVIFKAILENKFDLFVSNEILTEYQEVIQSRYGLTKTDAALDFLLLLSNVNQITPYFNWQLIERDKDDNKFVDCALAANCDFLVTNDKHFNILKEVEFPKLKTIKAEEFIEILNVK